MGPEPEQLERTGATDKTNPIVGAAPTAWAGTLWGLAEGLEQGSRLEHEATAAGCALLPGVTVCSLVLPRRNSQLAKQSHGAVRPVSRVAPVPPAPVAPQQMLAVRLLLAGMRVGEAAQSVGVCRHTISRWMKTPGFQAEARRQAREITVQRRREPGPRL